MELARSRGWYIFPKQCRCTQGDLAKCVGALPSHPNAKRSGKGLHLWQSPGSLQQTPLIIIVRILSKWLARLGPLMLAQLILFRITTLLGVVWLHWVHPREFPARSHFLVHAALYVFRQWNNTTKFFWELMSQFESLVALWV
jgi:hypothetical protein